MSAAIIQCDLGTNPMSRVAEGLRLMRQGRDLIIQARAVEVEMINGTADNPAHFTILATAGAFVANPTDGYATANDAALASFTELDTVYNLVKPGVAAGDAIDQACAKHGL